jgi:hypothetical protein
MRQHFARLVSISRDQTGITTRAQFRMKFQRRGEGSEIRLVRFAVAAVCDRRSGTMALNVEPGTLNRRAERMASFRSFSSGLPI